MSRIKFGMGEEGEEHKVRLAVRRSCDEYVEIIILFFLLFYILEVSIIRFS